MSPRGLKLPAPAGKAIERVSNFQETKPQSPSHAPSVGTSLLVTAVPIDIIEDILLRLPAQDILRMKQVRWDSGSMSV